MPIEKHQFLDEKGVETLAEELLKKINEMIDSRIVGTIDENSTDDQIPSAEAIANIIGTIEEEL